MIWLPTNICSLVALTVQLFLEQNEEEAEKMAEKEEKAREIEKSTIKVGGRLRPKTGLFAAGSGECHSRLGVCQRRTYEWEHELSPCQHYKPWRRCHPWLPLVLTSGEQL